ncbi:hypothetical protein ACH5RR_009309 [Cinchona calisaya]|uniref:Uncharacterized protein n=1 Tax=Cinchona calisaya TaxID=153742 RepID=A0ABD3AGU0_9GENT
MGSLAIEYTSSACVSTTCSIALLLPLLPPLLVGISQSKFTQFKEDFQQRNDALQNTLQQKNEELENKHRALAQMAEVVIQLQSKVLDPKRASSSSEPSIDHGPSGPSTS